MVKIGKKKELNTGDKCPKCKKGRIALASTLVDNFEWDSEPYKNGKHEKVASGSYEVNTDETLIIGVHVCDNCNEIISAWIDNKKGK